MDFSRMKQLVVPEGNVKKIKIGGRTVWQADTDDTPLTAAQISAIKAGTFENINVGYYWTFINVPYTYLNEYNTTKSTTYSGIMRVADCDYYLNTGDIPLTTHHVVVVPDTNMFNEDMNMTGTAEGGYVGSKMRTTYLRRAEAIFKACFGENHVLSHREFLVNTINSSAEVGKREAAGAWYDSTVELMDERMVWGTAKYANTSLPSVSNKQLTLFKNNSAYIATDREYWLRNVHSVYSFAGVNTHGSSTVINASPSMAIGVRPYALIY